jgi:hypothetical protein
MARATEARTKERNMIKAALLLTLVAGVVAPASAETVIINGILYGTVCRNGAFYFDYPIQDAQPVGTACPVRDNFGNVIGSGVVTNE